MRKSTDLQGSEYMDNVTDKKSKLISKHERYSRLRKIRIILIPFVTVGAIACCWASILILGCSMTQYVDNDPTDAYRQILEEDIGVTLPDDLEITALEGGLYAYDGGYEIHIFSSYTIEQWKSIGVEDKYWDYVDCDKSGNKLTLGAFLSDRTMEFLKANGEQVMSRDKGQLIILSVLFIPIFIAVFPIATILRNRTWKKLNEITAKEKAEAKDAPEWNPCT